MADEALREFAEWVRDCHRRYELDASEADDDRVSRKNMLAAELWKSRADALESALSELARLRAERDSLSAFAAKIFDGWPDDYTEMDGFDAQTIGLEYGILAREIMPAPCADGESCSCASNGAEFPTECYRFTSLLKPLPAPPVQSHEEKHV